MVYDTKSQLQQNSKGNNCKAKIYMVDEKKIMGSKRGLMPRWWGLILSTMLHTTKYTNRCLLGEIGAPEHFTLHH